MVGIRSGGRISLDWCVAGSSSGGPDYTASEGLTGGSSVTDIISIVGPESTGKTTLAHALAAHFGVACVEEYARAYLAGRPGYDRADVEAIARGQMALEAQALGRGRLPVIFDTDLLVIRIWWQEKYGALPDWLTRAWHEQAPRRYLLTAPDLAWEADPLRESPDDRERLFEVYRDGLMAEGLRFDIVRGTGAERLAGALAALEDLIVRTTKA